MASLMVRFILVLAVQSLPKQNQDQHDNQYEAKSAAAVIAGPVER